MGRNEMAVTYDEEVGFKTRPASVRASLILALFVVRWKVYHHITLSGVRV